MKVAKQQAFEKMYNARINVDSDVEPMAPS